jgi:hypothetical protein
MAHVRNEDVLQRVREEISVLPTIKRRKTSWIGYILPSNYFPKHVIERKIE